MNTNIEFERVDELTRGLLEAVGEDPERDGLVKTPHRVAKAWDYFSRGYRMDLKEIINGAIFKEECSEMVIVRDVEFFSMCEHHLLPFFGKAHVGYLPKGRLSV